MKIQGVEVWNDGSLAHKFNKDMELFFKLSGELTDLEDLAFLFPTGSATVVKVEEYYYLQLPEWEPPLDDNEALEAGKVALSRLNGIALLDLGNFRPPKINGISKRDPNTGKLTTGIILSGIMEGRSRMFGRLQVTLADGTISTGRSRTFGETILPMTDTNEFLERALFLYGTVEHNWRGLYMVLDAIAESYGGPKKLLEQGFAAKYKSDIENFKHHANSYRALGAEARHGLAKEEPPMKKMTLAEAQALIRDVLKGWVDKLKSGN